LHPAREAVDVKVRCTTFSTNLVEKIILRIFITFLFVCLLKSSFARVYYVSDAGNDADNGTSTRTAWQTITKVNAANLQQGDQVLFRRGDTFYGNIILPQSSNSVNITYGAYGDGEKPVITGFTRVTGWTKKRGNIWESTHPVSSLSDLKTVVINGRAVAMGRYPNGDASYPYLPHFFTFQSFTGTGSGASSITSRNLTDGNNWAGADVVIRMNQWAFHKERITSQSGATLNFKGIDGSLEANWGFFIQNDIRTLDRQNEWYYNPSTKKISIYSTSMPANVQVSTIDNLFYFYSNIPTVTSVTLDNLQLMGANTNAIWISGNLTFSVTNCNISYSGMEGIELYGGGILSGTIHGNSITNNGSSAISTTGTVSNISMTNNQINMSGVISAYKHNTYGNGGVEFTAANSLVQYNTIDSSAYCGINFNGTNVQIRNNFINHSALVRGDAGGIYTGYAGNPGKIIDANVVLNSQGNPRGARGNDYFAFGIYIDDLGNHITITNNTVANCRTAGIYLHNSNNLVVRNNKIYNCGAVGTERMWANGGISMDGNANKFANTVFNNTVTHNQIFATNQYQYDINYYSAAGSNNGVSDFGVIDSNYYVKVNSAAKAVKSEIDGVQNGTMSLSAWQSLSGKDIHSTARVVSDASKLKFVYNSTNTIQTTTLEGEYLDVKNNTYPRSITLKPYSSAVLIYDSPIRTHTTYYISTKGNEATGNGTKGKP
jgi:parallel beta-helix repeat protein